MAKEDLSREVQETFDKVGAAAQRVSDKIGSLSTTISDQSAVITAQAAEITRLTALIEGQPDLQAQLAEALQALNEANGAIDGATTGLDQVQVTIDAIAADPQSPPEPPVEG